MPPFLSAYTCIPNPTRRANQPAQYTTKSWGFFRPHRRGKYRAASIRNFATRFAVENCYCFIWISFLWGEIFRTRVSSPSLSCDERLLGVVVMSAYCRSTSQHPFKSPCGNFGRDGAKYRNRRVDASCAAAAGSKRASHHNRHQKQACRDHCADRDAFARYVCCCIPPAGVHRAMPRRFPAAEVYVVHGRCQCFPPFCLYSLRIFLLSVQHICVVVVSSCRGGTFRQVCMHRTLQIL